VVGLGSNTQDSESRLAAYVEALTVALGHADRAAPFRSYTAGLLLPGARKSVEPMAARVEPARVQAAHQSLHHFVAKADWSDNALLSAVRAHVLPVIQQGGPIRGWMIDDTGIPKKGTHSVGVARQYCGQLGKQDNCQVAVTLSLAADHASLPIAHRLYLPQPWAEDPARRAAGGVPNDVTFQTKPQIALAQITAAVAAGVPQAPVLADAGYGVDTAFRDGITALGLTYVVGIQSHTSLWPPGMEPLPPKPWTGRGRPPSLVRRDAEHAPMTAKALAASLPKRAWRRVTWREGSNTMLVGRFAAVRVRPAHRDYNRPTPRPEEWMLIEWPKGEPEPTKYWLSTLPPTVTRRAMVDHAKLRWRIERDYQDLKQELGLGHYEGRGWRGFHHHATLCIAAYGFLIAERGAFPPSDGFWPPFLQTPALPGDYRPRGAPDPA
jgi:SRSO17 transposase